MLASGIVLAACAGASRGSIKADLGPARERVAYWDSTAAWLRERGFDVVVHAPTASTGPTTSHLDEVAWRAAVRQVSATRGHEGMLLEFSGRPGQRVEGRTFFPYRLTVTVYGDELRPLANELVAYLKTLQRDGGI